MKFQRRQLVAAMAGLMLGAAAGGMIGAVMDKKSNKNMLARMGRKMLKKCTGIVSDLL